MIRDERAKRLMLAMHVGFTILRHGQLLSMIGCNEWNSAIEIIGLEGI